MKGTGSRQGQNDKDVSSVLLFCSLPQFHINVLCFRESDNQVGANLFK